MGFIRDTFSDSSGSFNPDILGLGGREAALAATGGAEIQAASAREAIEEERIKRGEAQEFFAPFAGAAERGIEGSKFLADPQAQFEFLQNNPLFQMALDSANTQTKNVAAARGRLSAGDTLQQLSNNVLLSASPLIDRQRSDINSLLNLGKDVTTSRANIAIGESANIGNLLTDIGATQAAGGVGAAQAQAQGNQNLASLGLGAVAAFSDRRLKQDIEKVGVENGFNIYSWTWNKIAESLGLHGSGSGVIADEVMKITPEAVVMDDGFMKVDYKMIGVTHGG